MTYETTIIGGGPGGVAAGVYAARKQLKTLFITKDWGGQSNVSENIQNWIGTPEISGNDLAKRLKEHLEFYKGEWLDIREGLWVTSIEKKSDDLFLVVTDQGSFESKTVLIAAGSSRRHLDVPGAALFENKGLTYCASCDGPLFANLDVAVIGGGNAGLEAAAQLLAYCKSVTLLTRGPIRADAVTIQHIKTNPKFTIIENAKILEIKGDTFVSGLVYQAATGAPKNIAVKGVFVEIGLIPNTDFAKNLVTLDKFNRIVTHPQTQRASIAGIWAAGDCTDGLFHQNNIAAGDAVKALEDLYLYLQMGK